MEEESWKQMSEDWAHGPPQQRGFAPEEDFRAGDGFAPGPGISMEQMMQHRMSEFGAMRRSDPRVGRGPGGAEFYNGPVNGTGYPRGGGKDDMGPPTPDMLRAMQEQGMALGKCLGGFSNLASVCGRWLTLYAVTGLRLQGGGAPNLANSLQNTTLGNYLTV